LFLGVAGILARKREFITKPGRPPRMRARRRMKNFRYEPALMKHAR
jgi:hypothetical protein